MKHHTIIILLLLLSCQNISNQNIDSKLPSYQEYNTVIKVILNEDTSFINKGGLMAKYLGPTMIKPHINLNSKPQDKDRIDTSLFQIFLLNLINISFIDSENLKEDSTYFVFQNQNSLSIQIIHNTLDSFKLANKKMPAYGYFQFSLPLFNSGKTKAYVEVQFISSFSGQRMFYILEKINNTWKLVDAQTRWVS